MKKKYQVYDEEQKEMNDELMKSQEKSEEQIRQLKNEIDSL